MSYAALRPVQPGHRCVLVSLYAASCQTRELQGPRPYELYLIRAHSSGGICGLAHEAVTIGGGA